MTNINNETNEKLNEELLVLMIKKTILEEKIDENIDNGDVDPLTKVQINEEYGKKIDALDKRIELLNRVNDIENEQVLSDTNKIKIELRNNDYVKSNDNGTIDWSSRQEEIKRLHDIWSDSVLDEQYLHHEIKIIEDWAQDNKKAISAAPFSSKVHKVYESNLEKLHEKNGLKQRLFKQQNKTRKAWFDYAFTTTNVDLTTGELISHDHNTIAFSNDPRFRR